MADLKGIKRAGYTKLTDLDEEKVSKIGTKSDGVTDAQHVIAEIQTPSGTPIDTAPFLQDYAIDSSRNNNSFNAEETIWSYTGKGKFISFWAEMNDEDFYYRLYIDGVQRTDVDMRMFKDAGLGKDNSALGQMDLYYEDQDKTMGHHAKYPITFSTSVEVRMAGIGGSNTVRGYYAALTKET